MKPYHEGAVLQVDAWLVRLPDNKDYEYELVFEFRNVGSNPFLKIGLESANIAITNGLDSPQHPERLLIDGVHTQHDEDFRLNPRHAPARIIENTLAAFPGRRCVAVALERRPANPGLEVAPMHVRRVPMSSQAEIATWEHSIVELLNVQACFSVGGMLDFFPVDLYLSSLNGPEVAFPRGSLVEAANRQD